MAWPAIAFAAALLMTLRILAPHMPHSLVALGDIFCRAGAFVFGGAHVVLPLLRDALVPAGWISDDAFLSGYVAAQALPGPLFSVAAYLGVASAPAGIAVLGIFLPGLMLAIAGRSIWHWVARVPRARAALAGVNAGAVGLLAAAFYNPLLTSVIQLWVSR